MPQNGLTNLSSLGLATTTATALANLILVTPQATVGYQPQNPPNTDGSPSTAQQPPAFLFNFEGEQSVQCDSDITDHYIEDNTALQDQIAIKPAIVRTHGFIGELNDVAPSALAQVKSLANKLVIVGAYTPNLSVSALLAYNNAFEAYQIAENAINTGISAWSSINGASGGESVISGQALAVPVQLSPNQNKQQQAFQQLYGYWATRTLFTVQTPWAVFQNMAIMSMRPIQDADDAYITTFEMAFKQMRFAGTAITSGTIGLTQQGRAALQSMPVSNLGTSTPIPSTSLSSSLSSNYGVA